MPTMKIHVTVAEKCLSILNIRDTHSFMLGTLFPDICSIKEDFDKERHKANHYYYPDRVDSHLVQANPTVNLAEFFIKNSIGIVFSSDFLKGWFVHLVCDNIFNKYANERSFIIPQAGKYLLVARGVTTECKDLDDLRNKKRDDFKRYASNLDTGRYAQLNIPRELEESIKLSYNVSTAEWNAFLNNIEYYLGAQPTYQQTEMFSAIEYCDIINHCVMVVRRFKEIYEEEK